MSESAAASPLQHSLFSPQSRVDPEPSATGRSLLWMSLFFPRLSLEVLEADVDARPWAVTDEAHGKPIVHAASQPARKMGVESGMALTAAYALCPELQAEPRDRSAEQACLTDLADAAMQYSSVVSLEPQALLLEVGASLKLFGGLQALYERVEGDLRQQPYEVEIAVAPSPQAALLLARCAMQTCITERTALRAELGRLPLAVLPVSEKQATLLGRMGLRELRDLWRLPRAGLIKRLGLEFIDYLDRLLCDKPELRLSHKSAANFSASWHFTQETENLTFILYGIEQLLPRLVNFMRLRELALNRLQVVFYHQDKQASRLELGTRQLCRDERHLSTLIRERFNQEKLAAPVLELVLLAEEFHPAVIGNQSLFAPGEEQDSDWQQVLDQLQTRLGEEAVCHLQLCDEHRPEYAWAYAPTRPVEPKTHGLLKRRPLWLMSQPQRLGSGLKEIQLTSEMERIEGGWWDGFDIRRDYYRARDRHGRRLWLFRNLQDGEWYLQGLFG
ncbi:MAG: DNA polymerase Y family protein [Candidatus Thiodiazotropha endolucinida]|nr:DNA polymerase Y family protein [Candidatus Thiodiazotropha taylori]MCG8107536.1 DNA polymerase Y family protein [Candidatus Thiodiazotropha taylori]MCW4279873.1 DNA polymerase Y family protein [Candidatus Thiodiazotropha taylori]MCW4304134.1 DNA polymerase Y family protein [Candidatus Thiodiazotropha taylori]